jgi:hypothetical protein
MIKMIKIIKKYQELIILKTIQIFQLIKKNQTIFQFKIIKIIICLLKYFIFFSEIFILNKVENSFQYNFLYMINNSPKLE